MARPRNNITKLPQETRLRIAHLLDDGATYDDLRADAEVAAACRQRGGLVLHNKSFLAYRESSEYDEYRRSVRRYGEELERRRMAAFFVESESGVDSLTRVINYNLLRRIIDKLESGEELEAKELRSLSGALASCDRSRIAALEAGYQARIAGLERQLAAQAGARGGISPETMSEIEQKIGVL